MSEAGGARNGLSMSDPFDRWFRYPAGFSRSSLKLALDAAQVGPDETVVDPFAGTASVGTAALQRGARFRGIEAHPEIAELARLKFSRPEQSGCSLTEAAAAIVESAQPMSTDSEHSLVLRCFDDKTLAQLIGLRNQILAAECGPWQTYLKWALLGTLREVASVKTGWPYQRPALQRTAPHKDPRKRFLQRIQWIAEDLEIAPASMDALVVTGDSRESAPWRRLSLGTRANASVASPPYFNNFDYADATRLELYFWGVASTWREMCDNVRSGMIVATTQQTRMNISDSACARLGVYPVFRERIAAIISALSTERVDRGRGKEYDRVVAPYFLGLAAVLSNMFEALRPGARCAWLIGDSAPYGVYIDTPALIGLLAQDLGFRVIADSEVRLRGQRWMHNGVRHRLALTERLVEFIRL